MLITPFGKTHLVDDLHDPGLGHGHLLRRFEDESIAGNHGIGQKPPGHHGRKVVWRDAAKDPHGLAMPIAVDVLGDILERVSAHERGHASGVLHIFDHAAHFPPRLVDGLAVLDGERLGDILEILLKRILKPKKITRPAQRRRFPPGPECRPGRLDGAIHIRCRSICHGGDFFSFCRIVDHPRTWWHLIPPIPRQCSFSSKAKDMVTNSLR